MVTRLYQKKMSSWFKKSTLTLDIWAAVVFFFSGLLTLRSVTVNFLEEWECLEPGLRAFYRDFLLQNCSQLVNISLPSSSSGFLGKRLCMCVNCVWMTLSSQSKVKSLEETWLFFFFFAIFFLSLRFIPLVCASIFYFHSMESSRVLSE